MCSPCSIGASRQQQDSSEWEKGIPVVLLRPAREGAAGHLAVRLGAGGALLGRGLLRQEERPHDRARVPGQGVVERFPVG